MQHNEISGGQFFNAVVQGRDVVIESPREITPALGGLPDRSVAFAGRDDVLRDVLGALDPEAGGVLVQAVSGLAGVGKSELVKQVAHVALGNPGWFPGGVLFADLSGQDPTRRLEPGQVLEGFLRSLAVPPANIPPDVQDRIRLYTSVLAAYAAQDKRLLVVLDNAADAAHVRPLLPTDGSTRALVTSRRRMGGLAARLVDLDVLTPEASVGVLRDALRLARGRGDRRVDDHSRDAATVAHLCGHLPLALRIAAALLADDPAWSLAEMAVALEDERARLDELSYEDRAVRAAFDLSYDRLDARHAQVFRLLAVNPGPEVSTPAAARLSDVDERTARRIATELARAHLIEHGTASGRWRMHDLVRIYAAEQGERNAEADDRGAALDRLLGYYLTTTQAATRVSSGDGEAGPFATREDAMSWLEAERPNLTAAVHAAGHRPEAVVALALAVDDYLGLRHRYPEWIAVADAAVTAARRSGDRLGEGRALDSLATALCEINAVDEAIEIAREAVAVLRAANFQEEESHAWSTLSFAFAAARRFGEATDAMHRSAMVFFEDADSSAKASRVSTDEGTLLDTMRKFDTAFKTYAEAMAAARESTDPKAAQRAGEELTFALTGERSPDRADEVLARRMLDVEAVNFDPGLRAAALHYRAQSLARQGRLAEAVGAFDDAVSAMRHADGFDGLALALTDRAFLMRSAGRSGEAVADLAEAAELFYDTSDLLRSGLARNSLGTVLTGLGRHEEAIEAFRAALDAFEQSSHRLGRTNRRATLNNLAIALDRAGRPDEATETRHQAATGT
ncbi:tetratricopeptide repeat protein [Saccharothrix sp. Mg75]|uniref:tetratricopeptide repeat protein n=1 Tax=Saccharothrix sp. Mg75 TaxID=3445357 RepID=UPI003EEC775C